MNRLNDTYKPEVLTANRSLLWGAALLSVVMMAPVAWLVGLSIKSNQDLMIGTDSVFRAPYTIANYLNIPCPRLPAPSCWSRSSRSSSSSSSSARRS